MPQQHAVFIKLRACVKEDLRESFAACLLNSSSPQCIVSDPNFLLFPKPSLLCHLISCHMVSAVGLEECFSSPGAGSRSDEKSCPEERSMLRACLLCLNSIICCNIVPLNASTALLQH